MQDFYQLLQPNMQLLRPPRKQDGGKMMVGRLVAYNQQSFEDEFGVQPLQVSSAFFGVMQDSVNFCFAYCTGVGR